MLRLSVFVCIVMLTQVSFAAEKMHDSVLKKLFSFEVDYQDSKATLLAFNLDFDEAQWFLFSDYDNKKLLISPNSMSQISQVILSDEKHLLAVLSVGEGHPLLDLVSISALLSATPETAKQFQPELTINPYPGNINIVSWDDCGLLIETDRLLSYKEHQSYPFHLAESTQYCIEAKTYNIVPISERAIHPAAFYIKTLPSAKPWDQVDMIEALVALQAKEAVPVLDQLLKDSKDENVHQKALEARRVLLK